MTPGAPTREQVVGRSSPDAGEALAPAEPISAPEVPADVVSPAPETAVSQRVAELDAEPPAEISLVHVRASGDSFVITAFEGGEELEIEKDKAGEDPFQLKLEPRDFLGWVDLLKDNPALQKFVRWVEERLAAHPGRLFLVIQEHTTTNVPWEMLKLGDSFLGARVNVVRWEGGQEAGARLGEALRREELCEGEVVAYVAQGVPDETDLEQEEKQAVEVALSVIHGGKPLRTVEELIAELEKEREGVGVLYLLCHGEIASKVQYSFLGAHEGLYPGEQLSLLKLRGLELELLSRSKAVVILDACTGGRVEQGSSQLPARTRVGFPQAFLGKGARGVIGAVAKLDVGHAVVLARDLLERARKRPRPVPELLRELRAEAAAALKDKKDPKRFERWYHTFLYVYYGHPLAKLSPGGKGGGRGT
jgi:transcriptional regulator of met regulon